MKRLALIIATLGLMGCEEGAGGFTTLGGGGESAAKGGSGAREFLVLGSRMTFEQCRAKGGLIIRDPGSPMVACDPRVLGAVVPADEFNHPLTASDT